MLRYRDEFVQIHPNAATNCLEELRVKHGGHTKEQPVRLLQVEEDQGELRAYISNPIY